MQAGPSQPVWFDPKLFAGVRGFAGAVWVGGSLPVVVLGGLAAAMLGVSVLLGVLVAGLVWTLAVPLGARGLARIRAARFAARRAPTSCARCGEASYAARCPGCGAALSGSRSGG